MNCRRLPTVHEGGYIYLKNKAVEAKRIKSAKAPKHLMHRGAAHSTNLDKWRDCHVIGNLIFEFTNGSRTVCEQDRKRISQRVRLSVSTGPTIHYSFEKIPFHLSSSTGVSFTSNIAPMDIVKASVFLLDTFTLEACYVRGRSIGLLLSFVLKLGGITWIRACKVSSELSVVPSLK